MIMQWIIFKTDIKEDVWIGVKKETKGGLYEQTVSSASFDDQSSLFNDGQPNEHDSKEPQCLVAKKDTSLFDDKNCGDDKKSLCQIILN